MKIENVLKITKKEIQSYLSSPSSYIVAVVFLILWEFLFFRSAFLVAEASLRNLYGIFPWLMLILVPAVTMSAFAKEKDDGTLEWLLTQPINELELVVGKFLGSLAFVGIVLMFVFPIAITFSSYGNFDWGVFSGQLLGSLLFAAAFIALGLFASGLVGTQIAALLLSVALGFVFIISGTELFTISMSPGMAAISERLSLASHLESMARGVIDLRDVWYFVSFIFVFLGLSYLQLLKRRFGNRKAMYRSFQVTLGLLIGIVVLTNILGNRISGRIDLTQNRIYTLSNSTKRILKDLNDIVTINLYASDKLPVQYNPILREVKDLLKDYENNSNNRIVVNIKNPSKETEISREAASYGVREIQFNVIGQEEFQVKTGYLGLAVSYAGQFESVPFIQTTSDLEYQLTSFIKKLTADEKKTVAFLSGHGEKDIFSEYTILKSELDRQFTVQPLVLEPEPAEDESEDMTTQEVIEVDPSIDVLVIAGPNTIIDDNVLSAISRYINRGGSVLFLADTYTVNMEFQSISENANSLASFLSQNGVTVEKNALYDLRFNDTIRLSDGMISYFLSYPYWLRAAPVDMNHPVTFKIESLLIPWGASLSVDTQTASDNGYEFVPLVKTSKLSGANSGSVRLDPNQKFSQENLGERTFSGILKSEDKGNIIVAGDSDFLSDQYVQSGGQNIIFGVNAISWLSEEDSLGDIRIKESPFGMLQFEDEDQPVRLKVLNLAIAGLVPAVYGILTLLKRRNISTRVYKTSK